MNITVILCTYNRCQVLSKALDSLAASTVPDLIQWEVLVVDNNSHDQTREVVEEFSRRFPGRFQYSFEPQAGKSNALNRGIREAEGDVLAFVDDDVTVEPAWLSSLTGSLDDDTWAGAGGRIVLDWPPSVPAWLSTEGPYARHAFPGFDQGPEPKDLIGPPFGTNMAFRKAIFTKYGGFRTDLGPTPGSEIRSEDTEFGRRLIFAGERLRYEPAAVVYHPVPASKINKKHFLNWWFDKGRADAREFPTSPLHLFCSLAAWTARWMTALARPTRFHAKLVVWEKAGTITEWSRLSFGDKKKRERNAEA